MKDATVALPRTGWRIKAGIAMFVCSVILPAVGVPLVAALRLPVGTTVTVSGVLLASAELLGIAAVATMGRPGFVYIKNRALAFLKRHGPPREVSRARYRLGLVMFCTPILFAWLSIYVAEHIPGLARHPLPFAIGGDLLLLASLFVLGGGFWDKLRSLFLHDAAARLPESPEADGLFENTE